MRLFAVSFAEEYNFRHILQQSGQLRSNGCVGNVRISAVKQANSKSLLAPLNSDHAEETASPEMFILKTLPHFAGTGVEMHTEIQKGHYFYVLCWPRHVCAHPEQNQMDKGCNIVFWCFPTVSEVRVSSSSHQTSISDSLIIKWGATKNGRRGLEAFPQSREKLMRLSDCRPFREQLPAKQTLKDRIK